ncbi:MAG: sulfotransferase [Phycisphaerales bacterium]|nr:MAG: sulfotransferase [Phycisphaerales bacterium]
MTEPRYFFITGTGRSGTTLLQAMLSQGKGVYVPPETHFMGLLWQHRRRLGPLQSDQGWAAARSAIERRYAMAGIPFDPQRFDTLTEGAPRHLATLLAAWLRMAAEAATRTFDRPMPTLIGEKSPGHTPYALELLAMMPGSSVVHIVRDPRDVAVSQREAWKASPLAVAIRWRIDQQHQETYEQIIHPSRFATVRYEDLVREPKPQLQRLCAVLGIEFDSAMLEPHKRADRGFADHETHKLRTLQPVTDSRIGRYRSALSAPAVAAIDWICGRQMRRLGYQPQPHLPGSGALAAAAMAGPMACRRLMSRTPAARIARQVGTSQTPAQPSDLE